MKGKARTGVAYELMPNYGEQGFPSQYWTAALLATLPPASRAACERCYPAAPPQGGDGLQEPDAPGDPGADRLGHVNSKFSSSEGMCLPRPSDTG